MNAFLAIPENALKPVPLFVVQPRDKQPASESSRQAAFRALLRMAGPSVLTWSTPNAAVRGPRAIAQAKREGLRAGVFDEAYAWNHGIAFLEWKNGGGSLRPQQIDWGNAMVERGFRVACVRTPEFALEMLREWGAPVRGVGL